MQISIINQNFRKFHKNDRKNTKNQKSLKFPKLKNFEIRRQLEKFKKHKNR